MNAPESSPVPSKSFSAAVLGCGRYVEGKVGWAIGHSHARGWQTAFPNVTLYGVDPSAENLQAFGREFKLPPENLFSSTDDLYAAVTPDYVSVCTWPSLHAPQVIEAAGRKVKGIACEKPMALDGCEMDQMTAACEKFGVRLVIAHQRRHSKAFERARQLVAEGKLGDGLVLEARVTDGWDILSWTTHWFDIASFILDAEPDSVLAGVDFTGERRYQHAVENSSTVFVQFRGGAQGIFISGPPSADGYSVHVRGSRGYLSVVGDTLKLFTEEGFSVISSSPAAAGGFAPLLASLVHAVENHTTPRCDVSQTRLATEVAYAAHESARTRRVISLPSASRFAPLEVLAHPAQPILPTLTGKVILLADDHFGSRGRHGLAGALQAVTGREVIDKEAAGGLAKDELDHAGLLVIYHTQKEASPATKAALDEWVAKGHPLLVAHCAIGAYPEWEEYRNWCGRVWAWGKSAHPYEACVLIPENGSSFPWSEAWLPSDEVFIRLEDRSEIIDHCSVRISSGDYPAAWTSKRWPNIGIWLPGHREDICALPAFRDGLRTMIGKILRKNSC